MMHLKSRAARVWAALGVTDPRAFLGSTEKGDPVYAALLAVAEEQMETAVRELRKGLRLAGVGPQAVEVAVERLESDLIERLAA